ncbi:MAG TPA: hypothetical protein DCS66_08725 [Flavobacteriaceae bacterium]|nr:hypothetical protein [Flavobacteriaceae bacterium]HAT64670.1 hypothetical protein [Flavobacteriaceae bacterium]|tara:strand:- start:66673 stop:68154 length:1482 start_codon:yes stop_codon:yes gene_type:complete
MKGINNFLNLFKIDGTSSLWIGFICGLYPFLFYVSNNFYATNSWENWGFYLLFFIGIPILIFSFVTIILKNFKRFAIYKNQILFVLIILLVVFFTSYASSLVVKKKLLLVALVVSVLLSLKLSDRYKKLLPLILVVSILPLSKLAYKVYDQYSEKTWLMPTDPIEEVTFAQKPNVYVIQPDGYVSKSMMESDLYNYETTMYNWLETNNFKIYDPFRSNYPASLNSNASLFAMQHHYFGSSLLPDLEMPYARETISGDNPVVRIFKRNGYHTFFIAEDEYFQQNRCEQLYDYTNTNLDEIPYFGGGGDVTRDVLADVKEAFKIDVNKPKFFFIEKCLPHHVHFEIYENRIEAERLDYLSKIEEVNIWLKETISFIESKDPNAVIIVLADHGGWVGVYDYKDMFSTRDATKIESIYASLCAIKWNGLDNEGYDEDLKSNVNVFRVLFSALSKNKAYLKHLEGDESYNLNNEGSFFKSVRKVIDKNGNVVYEKLNN